MQNECVMKILDFLADQVYLSPNLRHSEMDVEAGLAQVGLIFPLQIMVMGAEGASPSLRLKKRGKRFYWSPHAGLTYVFWNTSTQNEPSASLRDGLTGEVLECREVAHFINTLCSAIVSFRRRELSRVWQRRPQELSFAAELEARRLAMRKIQLGLTQKTPFAQQEWQAGVELWLDVVLLRHQKHLHTVRRKLQEFLGLLTCELDTGNALGNRFHLAQRFVQETYSLVELREGFLVWLGELLEEFPGQALHRIDVLSPFCRQAVEWMEQRYSEPVSVADCAAAIPINASYLSRLFKQEMGQSPVHFLQKLRIDHARRLLGQNRHTMQELARLCGFGSVEHFHRVFVRQVGMTPARYRRNTRPG